MISYAPAVSLDAVQLLTEGVRTVLLLKTFCELNYLSAVGTVMFCDLMTLTQSLKVTMHHHKS